MIKVNFVELTELSYSDLYRNWTIEAYGASLESAQVIMKYLIGFDDFLEEEGIELGI